MYLFRSRYLDSCRPHINTNHTFSSILADRLTDSHAQTLFFLSSASTISPRSGLITRTIFILAAFGTNYAYDFHFLHNKVMGLSKNFSAAPSVRRHPYTCFYS